MVNVDRHIYLCSSVRHVYLAVGIAASQPEVEHHLVMIGQKPTKGHVLHESLTDDSGVFKSFKLLYDRRGAVAKYLGKRKAIKQVAAHVNELGPQKIFVGNDRRLEFQYAMFTLRNQGHVVEGAYLDDGTGSYLTRRYMTEWGAFTDRYFDRPVKNILYGSWCERVRHLGGTSWIDTCYLNFPDLAPDIIKKEKKIIPLQANWYKSSRFITEVRRLFRLNNGGESLGETSSRAFDALLILPSRKFVTSQFSSVEEYNLILNKYLSRFSSIAIKYHPRETDLYFKCEKEVVVLPTALPAEILFSLIDVRCVMGDLSSALLSAVWLYPGIEAICLWPKHVNPPPIMQIIEKTPVAIEWL